MKSDDAPIVGINLNGMKVLVSPNGGGNVVSSIERMTCPFCGEMECIFSCDQSQADGEEGEVQARLEFNASIDAIESLVLAHACEGIDVASESYQNGLQAALDTINAYVNG
jgi:hypothetical protein